MHTQLIKALADTLLAKQWQIVTAESCTGGLIAALLTDMPGSSRWFERGFVVYSNAAKEQMLQVPAALLAQYGAVSEPVALAMAEGALKHSAGQMALSVTGIAGPEGGSLEKPVGLVCFGFACKDKPTQVLSCHFSGNRQAVREAACQKSLEVALSILNQT